MMTFKECLRYIKSDLAMFPKKNFGGIKYFFSNASFKLTIWLRIGHYLRQKRGLIFKLLYGMVFLIHKHNQYLTGIQIRLETKVGEGLRFQHFSGIVINEAAVIGHHCLIFHGVTIGAASSGIPRIGNHVILSSGCKVIGGVHIGDNVIIGANAVVTHDIPDNSIAVGIPAKVIGQNNSKKMADYYRH